MFSDVRPLLYQTCNELTQGEIYSSFLPISLDKLTPYGYLIPNDEPDQQVNDMTTTESTIVTKEGHTLEDASDILCGAFEEAFPDQDLRRNDSDGWAVGIYDWLVEGDWSDLPTLEELKKECINAMYDYVLMRREES